MRYPYHIILDISKLKSTDNNTYWIDNYRLSFVEDTYFNSTLKTIKPLKPSNKSLTIYPYSTTIFKSTAKRLKKTDVRLQNKSSSLLWSLFDINFIKREKIYTKLKYSRSPQYDIVSGGVAALFAGFIGFLVSEKFGLELMDSGDFYTFFMYCVFLFFALRPLLKILSKEETTWNFFSLKFLLNYLHTIIVFVIRSIKNTFNKVQLVGNPILNKFKMFVFLNECLTSWCSSIYEFFIFLKTYPNYKKK